MRRRRSRGRERPGGGGAPLHTTHSTESATAVNTGWRTEWQPVEIVLGEILGNLQPETHVSRAVVRITNLAEVAKLLRVLVVANQSPLHNNTSRDDNLARKDSQPGADIPATSAH